MKNNSEAININNKASTSAPAAQPPPASHALPAVESALPAAVVQDPTAPRKCDRRRLSVADALAVAYDDQGNQVRRTRGFTKDDPNIWRGGRPAGTGFTAWRTMAKDWGNQLAYTRDGKAVIWRGKHLTFMENILLVWCTDSRLMQNFIDAAFGKVPQAIEVKKQTATIIDVRFTVGGGTRGEVIDADADPALLDDGE